MRKIANIITDSQQTYFSASDLYNVVKTKDEINRRFTDINYWLEKSV